MNVGCQKSKLMNYRKVLTDSPILHFTLCISISLTLVIGCANPDENGSTTVQLEQLTQENKELQNQIEQSEKENEQLKKQVQTLSGLPENVKLENINQLENIKIGRYTGFFDKDGDGKKEKLIVYLQPTDAQGDAIKAVGTAEIQLWDLNKTNNEALLGQWKIEPDELKNLWFETLISIYYRLTFDVAGIVENLEEPPTVKITFTDYLTGKVFNDQKVIKAP